MPVLILLNGLPASGKSTLARAWCARHGDRLPLALDVDLVRSMLGGWQRRTLDAGHSARAIALAAAVAHLGAGRDVIVPQWLVRPDFADRLERAAAGAGSAFLECVLMVDPAVAAARFEDRAGAAQGRTAEGALGRPVAEVAADFARFVSTRPSAVRIEEEGEAALDRLDRAVSRALDLRGAGAGPACRSGSGPRGGAGADPL